MGRTAAFYFMALTKDQKKKTIEDLKEKIDKQKSIVFIDFSKVNSKDIFALRKKLKVAGCILKVAKKTLLGIAFGKDNSVWKGAEESIPGQLAVVFGIKDEMAPAKITEQFTKESDNIKILGGIFENRFIDKAEVVLLSRIPSKEELLSKLVGSISSPISSFINVLQGNIKGLINVLTKINN